MIPTTSPSVNVTDLDTELSVRLEAFVQHPDIRGRAKVVSGARTVASQVALWIKSRTTGSPPVAANPYRKIGPGPGGMWKGSYHMIQPDGRAHAVDLRITGAGLTWRHLHHIAEGYGLQPTVLDDDGNVVENWHLQAAVLAAGRLRYFPAPALDQTPAPAPVQPTAAPPTASNGDVDVKIIQNRDTGAAYLVDATLGWSPLSGPDLADLRQTLANGSGLEVRSLPDWAFRKAEARAADGGFLWNIRA